LNLEDLERLKEFERRLEGHLDRGERRRLRRNRRVGLLTVRSLLIGGSVLLVAAIVCVIFFLLS
jgi:hypothetical protein